MAPESATIYVMDLAEAHSKALDHLFERQTSEPLTLNIGTGRGLSVLDVVHGFEQATGSPSPMSWWSVGQGMCRAWRPARRPLKPFWLSANRTLEEMCRDGWAWQQSNPTGYRSNP